MAPTLVGLLFGILAIALTASVLNNTWAQPSGAFKVALLADSGQSPQESLIVAAYEQILKEEGFKYDVISYNQLISMGAGQLKDSYEALIVPEIINSFMPPEVADPVYSFVRDEGGHVLLSLDPATRLTGGERRQLPLLADLAGVAYCLPAPGGQETFYRGYWHFYNAAEGQAWGMTPGKLDKDNAVCTYSYGRLQYDHSRAKNIDARMVAYDRLENVEIPVLTVKEYNSGGSAVYANLPLGRYKLRSDDLALRSVLRTFLIRQAKLPRLVNSPGGGGGIVFNLHICSGAYFRPLTVMTMHGLFNKELPFSIHITAGPDTYKLGDGMGYFAENSYRGKPFLETMHNYGEIGSHGGWIHNFFAYNLDYLPQDKAAKLLEWNSSALEAVTGKKVLEYSAPGGNHPFWINSYLENAGVKAYYYAGDTGSSPSHPRLDDEYGGEVMWSFPITPFLEYASLEEMERGLVKPSEVKGWLEDLVEFSARERVIRMIYTHPADTVFGIEAIKAFEKKVMAEQSKERIIMAPMSSFADFLSRHARTEWQVQKNGKGGYIIDLQNDGGLKDITVALFAGEGDRFFAAGGDLKVAQEDGWLYLTVVSEHKKKRIEVIMQNDQEYE